MLNKRSAVKFAALPMAVVAVLCLITAGDAAEPNEPSQVASAAAIPDIGQPLEWQLEGVAAEAAACGEVRVVVRSRGEQGRITATAEAISEAGLWRFTPQQEGTYVIATVCEPPTITGSNIERLYYYEKQFVRVGPTEPDSLGATGPSASATAKFGHRLELIPMVDPAFLTVGADLPLRVQFDGAGLHGIPITLTVPASAGATEGEQPADNLKSSTPGGFNIHISHAGKWTVAVQHQVAVDRSLTGPEEVIAAAGPARFVARITFDVRADSAQKSEAEKSAPSENAHSVEREKTPVALATRQSGSTWEPWGPAPIGGVEYTGRVAALAVSPTDPDQYYVGGADGGVWRTNDGGSTWIVLTDEMPTSAVGALALDPNDEDTIYVGTGEANFAYHSRFGLGIYKSTDGGDSWQHLAEADFGGRCISRILVDPSNSSVVYAAVTRAGGFLPGGSAAKNHPEADGPVGVFKSTDGGTSWMQLTNGLPNLDATDMAMQPDDPLVLYAGIGNIFGDSQNGIYKTDDGGQSWSKLVGGLPTTNVGRISLTVAPSEPLRLYTAITQEATDTGGSAELRGVYRSDNGGASWTQKTISNYMSSYGWYLNIVTVQPTDPDVVLVGGLTAHRSTNGGSSWSSITPPHVDLHAYAWDASGRLLAGDDGGVHRSVNLGNSWQVLNNGLGIIQFYAGFSLHPTSDEIAFGGTQDNGTNKRIGPNSWSHVFGGDGGYTAINPSNPNIVFCEYQGTGNLYRSTNGGSSFNYSGSGISGSDRNCFLPPFEIDSVNNNRMVYGTHRVYESTSGGTSWSSISGDLTATSYGAIHSITIAPSDPQTIWVTTNDGNVQVTFNGGSQWNLVRQNLPGWIRAMRQVFVAPDNHLVAYLAGSAFGTEKVLRTQDGGQGWEVLDGDLPDMPVNTVTVDTRPAIDVLYVGTEGGVYRSLDDGTSWHRFGQGMPHTAVTDLRLDIDRNRLLASTQGRGAWMIGLCAADLTGDDQVNIDDIFAVLGLWGNCDDPCPPYCDGDLTGDCTVNIDDIFSILGLWGPCN